MLRIANTTDYVYGNMTDSSTEYGVCYSSSLEAESERVFLECKSDMYDDESLKLDNLPHLAVYGSQFECDKKDVLALNRLNLYVLICYNNYMYEFVKAEHRIVISAIDVYDPELTPNKGIVTCYKNYLGNVVIRKNKVFSTINFDDKIIKITGEDLYNKFSDIEKFKEIDLDPTMRVNLNYNGRIKELVELSIESFIDETMHELIKEFISL